MATTRAWTTPKSQGDQLTPAEANNLNDLPMARGGTNDLLDGLVIDLGDYDLNILNSAAGAGRFDVDLDYTQMSGSAYPTFASARTVSGYAAPLAPHWTAGEYTTTGQRHQQVANSVNISYWVTLPTGMQVTGVVVRLKKAAGAGSLPGTMPTVNFGYYDLTADTFTSIGTQADTSADIATYKTYHAVTLTFSAHTIAVSRNYLITITGDNNSTGAGDGLYVYRPVLNVTVPSLRAILRDARLGRGHIVQHGAHHIGHALPDALVDLGNNAVPDAADQWHVTLAAEMRVPVGDGHRELDRLAQVRAPKRRGRVVGEQRRHPRDLRHGRARCRAVVTLTLADGGRDDGRHRASVRQRTQRHLVMARRQAHRHEAREGHQPGGHLGREAGLAHLDLDPALGRRGGIVGAVGAKLHVDRAHLLRRRLLPQRHPDLGRTGAAHRSAGLSTFPGLPGTTGPACLAGRASGARTSHRTASHPGPTLARSARASTTDRGTTAARLPGTTDLSTTGTRAGLTSTNQLATATP